MIRPNEAFESALYRLKKDLDYLSRHGVLRSDGHWYCRNAPWERIKRVTFSHLVWNYPFRGHHSEREVVVRVGHYFCPVCDKDRVAIIEDRSPIYDTEIEGYEDIEEE